MLLNKLSFKKRKLNIESYSLAHIHGISQSLLSGSPTLTQVYNHIKSISTEFEKNNKEGVVLVGHSIINDIEAMKLDKVAYIDTTNFKFKSDQHGKIRKLKDLVKENLDMEIQEDCHTSLQDA
jgi:ATP-dependent RNA circularization protein (DNA/RNA ligase family)